MSIHYYCEKCGKEMFDLMEESMKKTTTIHKMEVSLKRGCSDCVLYEITNGRVDLRIKGDRV